MNALIDFLPALLFLGTYAAYGIYTATAVLIVGMFALVAWYWFREHRLHKAHFITALVALVLGGLTTYVHDARSTKFKPTVVYAVFSLAMLGSHMNSECVTLNRLPQKLNQHPRTNTRRIGQE